MPQVGVKQIIVSEDTASNRWALALAVMVVTAFIGFLFGTCGPFMGLVGDFLMALERLIVGV